MPAPIDLDARRSSPGQSSCYPTSTRSGGGRVTLRASSVFLCMVHVRLTTTRLAAQLVRARVARSSRRTACGEAIVERKRRPACVRPSRHCTPLDKFGQNCSRVLISRRSSPSIDGAARFRSPARHPLFEQLGISYESTPHGKPSAQYISQPHTVSVSVPACSPSEHCDVPPCGTSSPPPLLRGLGWVASVPKSGEIRCAG